MMRLRGRPKVMLARTYEEAMELYEQYSKNILGVISDVSFTREGKKDSQAGIKLAKALRERDPYLPLIIESSEVENEKYVKDFQGTFIDKNSKKLPVDLGCAIMENFGFGDFIIKNPNTGEELLRIKNLKDLQNNIFYVPDESLFYHASYNDISRWLYSRAMFPIAEVMKMHRFTDISEAPAVRQLIFDLIVKYRKMKNRGVVAIFKRDRFDHYSNFARIGQGSLGGKGRGLAFIDSVIKNFPECDNFEGVTVQIPRTVVICTDIFDEFMEANNLYQIALSDAPDEEILQAFLAAHLPENLQDDFYALFEVVNRPLAVRSSSLLEDSHYQPFAGIYSTYMIPLLKNKAEMLRLLCDAIKSVYASVFFADSKAYMTATRNIIDQEKMAIILQEVVGTDYGDVYYPSFSGVGRSLNYYPINDEKAEEGVAEVAVGLGKYIVDGGQALRFSPHHPDSVLQTSTLDLALRDTQTRFYALDMKNETPSFSVDDGFNIKKMRIQDAVANGSLKYMVSTYDHYDGVIRDSDYGEGRRVVTFANMLQHRCFPLANIVAFMLEQGQKAMQRPVEIEFAGIVDRDANDDSERKGQVYWLQIRPMVDRKEMLDEDVANIAGESVLVRSENALGHGMMDNIKYVVIVKPERFSMSNNLVIAREIEKINRNFTQNNENYVLIGPGRWGSSDSALGIPVKWPHISAAKVIVETALKGNSIDPSQGTHFFQNLTSFGVGYFTVNEAKEGNICDMDYLNTMPVVEESENVKVVAFDESLVVAINGRKGIGAVLKPGYKTKEQVSED
jgi:hypothetical protein